jgi:hypothetical protein
MTLAPAQNVELPFRKAESCLGLRREVIGKFSSLSDARAALLQARR